MIRNNWRKKGKQKGFGEISLTPLIDTALTLLVIFMVTTPMINNGLNIDLPKGQVDENSSSASQDLVIYIDKHGETWLNEELAHDNLIELLHQKIGKQKGQTVFVNADQDISYGTVVEIVDKIKFLSGVENVILSTKRV